MGTQRKWHGMPLVCTVLLFGSQALAQVTPAPKERDPIIIDLPASSVDISDAVQMIQFRLAEKAGLAVGQIRVTLNNAPADAVVPFDISTGKASKAFELTPNTVVLWRAMEISPDGSRVSFLTQDQSFESFDLKTKKAAWTWQAKPGEKVDSLINFSADKCFAAGTIDRSTVILWDLANGHAKSAKLDFLKDGEGAMVLPRDASSSLLFTSNKVASDDDHKFNVDLFNLSSGERQHLTEAFSGHCFVLPKGDEAVILRGKEVMRPIGESGMTRVQELYWSAVELWDLEKRQRISTSPLVPSLMASRIKMSADGRFIIFHEYRHRAFLYDIAAGSVTAAIGPESGCDFVDISDDGRLLAATITQNDVKGKPHTKLVTYSLEKLSAPGNAK